MSENQSEEIFPIVKFHINYTQNCVLDSTCVIVCILYDEAKKTFSRLGFSIVSI